MIIPSKIYEPLKWLALIVLPAFVTLYLALGMSWEWPNTEKVATSITAVDAFLGAILQISSAKFKSYQNTDEALDGYVTPTGEDPDTGIPGLAFTISRHPKQFLDQGVVRMKVGSPPANPVYREPLPDADLQIAEPERPENPS